MTRWTMADVVRVKSAQERALERMREANTARGYNLLPVEAGEAQTLPLTPVERDRTPRKSRKPKEAARQAGWNYEPFGCFCFRLPWAPSVNNCYANKTNGGRVKVKRARQYAETALAALVAQKVPCRKLAHPLAITYVQHASRTAGDVANYEKILTDTLVNYGVIADDHRGIVKRVTLIDGSRVDKGQEFVEVSITCLSALEPSV
jgi:Holliday junction resolvase RusA-like endonuclease